MKIQNIKTKGLKIFAGMMAAASASPAFAHHPGALGPITHLGVETVSKVAGVAILDGINPTALGVLLFILWKAAEEKKSGRKIASLYILGIMTSYLIVGLFFRQVYIKYGPTIPVLMLQGTLALLLFLSGFSELAEAMSSKAKKLINIPRVIHDSLDRFLQILGKGGAFPFGLVIGIIELFATGAIYLAFIQSVTYDPTARLSVVIALISIYLFMFMLPMLAVMVYQPLVDMLIGENRQTKSGRIARSIVGLLFMGAAAFIAANTAVTLKAIL